MMPTNRIGVWVPILLVCVRGMLFPCQFTASVILYTPRFFLCVHIVCSVCLTSIIKGRKNVYVSFYSRQHQYVNVRITFRISVCRKEKKRLFLQCSYSCVNHTLNRLKRLRISNGIQFDTNEHSLHRCYWHTLILCSIVSLGIYTPMSDVHCVYSLDAMYLECIYIVHYDSSNSLVSAKTTSHALIIHEFSRILFVIIILLCFNAFNTPVSFFYPKWNKCYSCQVMNKRSMYKFSLNGFPVQ